MSDLAPKCPVSGNAPYVVTEHSWGKTSDRVQYAANLKEAKAKFGYTRMRYTAMTVRRARAADLETIRYGWCKHIEDPS